MNLPELKYINLWFYMTFLTSLISSEFHILGNLIATGKISWKRLGKFFIIGLIRFFLLVLPAGLYLVFFKKELETLFYILLLYLPIAGILNLIINALFYKSFTFLILSISDAALLWSCFVYAVLVIDGLILKAPCTFLTGLIIIIPLFAQVAYYVADGISRYAEKIGARPQSAMAAVVGLSITFFIYIANGILFLLYPTFKMCVEK